MCSKIELIRQVLEFVEELCYFGDTAGGRRGAIDGILTRARNRCSKCKNLINFLTKRVPPFAYYYIYTVFDNVSLNITSNISCKF